MTTNKIGLGDIILLLPVLTALILMVFAFAVMI
jgi:hypothetical protein